MIVHVFTGERYHLVPSIAKGYATVYNKDVQHCFLLMGSNHIDKVLYDKVFNEVGFTNYHFVMSKWQLFGQLWKNRNYSILFHAGDYIHFLIAFVAGCNHVNWVCWGAGASIHHNWKSMLSIPLKCWIYHRFYSIVTLMNADRVSIIHDFKVSHGKIKTIPYTVTDTASPYDEICLRLLKKANVTSREKPVVLLGNNPGNIRYYIELMELLRPFKGKICVHCMMNYSLVRNQQYYDFIRYGYELFGDDFHSNEEFYQGTENYANYMNMCDIYMCGNPDQTGLGALGMVLRLGKKIYVTGKNYDWAIKECGVRVFHLSDLSTFGDFVKPLSDEEKMHNYQVMLNRRILLPIQWREYLHQLDLVGKQDKYDRCNHRS